MKQFLFLPILAILLFSQCRKEETLKVIYTIAENSAAQPSFTITYTADKSGNSNIASSSAESWTSDVMLLEQGQFVSMKAECAAPEFEIKMNIFVNGFLWKTETFSDPVASKELKGNI